MLPADRIPVVAPTVDLAHVWEVMAQSGGHVVAVYEGPDFLGIITTEDYAAGFSWAQRLIEIAPEDEASRRDMMSLLAGSGQTAAALQEFELLKRYLQEDGLVVAV